MSRARSFLASRPRVRHLIAVLLVTNVLQFHVCMAARNKKGSFGNPRRGKNSTVHKQRRSEKKPVRPSLEIRGVVGNEPFAAEVTPRTKAELPNRVLKTRGHEGSPEHAWQVQGPRKRSKSPKVPEPIPEVSKPVIPGATLAVSEDISQKTVVERTMSDDEIAIRQMHERIQQGELEHWKTSKLANDVLALLDNQDEFSLMAEMKKWPGKEPKKPVFAEVNLRKYLGEFQGQTLRPELRDRPNAAILKKILGNLGALLEKSSADEIDASMEELRGILRAWPQLY